MMISEFIERTGFETTAEEYEKIEEEYYNFNGTKEGVTMKYYVEQKYYDTGKVDARILFESEVVGVPGMGWHAGATPNESRYQEFSGYDLYVDVFESYEEAEEFMNDALRA